MNIDNQMCYFNSSDIKSIHTIELEKKVVYDDYEMLKENLLRLASEGQVKVIPRTTGLHCYILGIKGITICLVPKLPAGHFIQLKLNLKELAVNKADYYELFSLHTDSIEKVHDHFVNALQILGHQHTVDTFYFSRIDFCANAICNSPEEVDAYIALARKGNYPRGYQDTYPRAAKREGRKKIKYRNSFDLTNRHKDISLSLYNKGKQLLDIHAPEFWVKQAQCILRFEIRCGKKEINDLLGNPAPVYYYDYEVLQYFLKIASNRIREELEHIFTPGTYYKLPTACHKIKSSEFKPKAKDHMIFWILYSSEHQRASIGWARAVEEYALNADQQRKLKRHMQELQINPVTIGRRFPCEELASIPKLFGIS